MYRCRFYRWFKSPGALKLERGRPGMLYESIMRRSGKSGREREREREREEEDGR